MKKFLLILFSIIVLVISSLMVFTYLKQKVKPPEAITEVLKIDVPASNINLPISYDLKSFAAFLNKKINGKFLEKSIPLQESKKEEIALILTKKEDIIIKTTGSQLVCTFPLTVDATLTESRLGKFLTKQVHPVHASILITLSTPVSLDKTWRLITKFTIKELKWLEEPVVKVGFVKKNLTKTLDKVIKDNSADLAAMLDGELNKAVSLKPDISKIWNDLQLPILITRKPTPAWMKFFCNDIKAKIVLYPTKITCFTNVQAKMLMLTDTTTEAKAKPLPNLKALKEATTASDIHLYAYTSFDEINGQLNALLQGKILSSHGYSVAIKELKAYSSTAGLSVQVVTDKDVEGQLVASGKLVFDVPNQSLKVQNFDFNLNTNRAILNTSENLLHDLLRDTIASKLSVNLDSLIKKVPMIIHQAIAKGNAGKTIDLNIENLEIKQCDILMSQKSIHFKINISIEANIKLKTLNAGTTILVTDKASKK